MSIPVENCFISLTTNFSFHFSKFWAVPHPLPPNPCKVQKNVGKNWDERGWGLTYICLGLQNIHSRCWCLAPVRVITLGIGQNRDSTGLTLLFRVNNIPTLFYGVCLTLWFVHSCQQFTVVLHFLYTSCTRNFFVLEHIYSSEYRTKPQIMLTWTPDTYRRDERQIHPELHFEVELIYTCQLCR